MNYEIIKDEEALNAFINWLPELKKNDKDNEVFYMCLFARKKYFKDLISTSNDKTQLRRELVTKYSIKRELRKWECTLGTYKLKKDVVPQEALAVYISPNPRSMRKATFRHLRELAEFVSNETIPHNLHQNAISCVQKSKSYNYVVDFDIDSKKVDLKLLKDILPKNTFEIIETRGGYHILVYPKRASDTIISMNRFENTSYELNWFMKLVETFDIDQSSDGMVPIVGCTQGGFVPKFKRLEWI